MFPFAASDFNFILLEQVKAVSVAEKKAENPIKTKREINKGMDPSGIKKPQVKKMWKHAFPYKQNI